MPFLPQPSPFIQTWDRRQETQECASDDWVVLMAFDGWDGWLVQRQAEKKESSFFKKKIFFNIFSMIDEAADVIKMNLAYEMVCNKNSSQSSIANTNTKIDTLTST